MSSTVSLASCLLWPLFRMRVSVHSVSRGEQPHYPMPWQEAAASPQEEQEIRDAVAAAGPGMTTVKFQGKEITARIVGDEGGSPIYIGFDKKCARRTCA